MLAQKRAPVTQGRAWHAERETGGRVSRSWGPGWSMLKCRVVTANSRYFAPCAFLSQKWNPLVP